MPVLPSLSVARTANVWSPAPSPEYAAGLVHVEKAPPSSLQPKDTLRLLWRKTKVALLELVGFAGPLSIVGAGGGSRSSVHVNEEDALVLPAGSNALAAVNPNVGLVSLDRLDDVLVTFGARGTAAVAPAATKTAMPTAAATVTERRRRYLTT